MNYVLCNLAVVVSIHCHNLTSVYRHCICKECRSSSYTMSWKETESVGYREEKTRGMYLPSKLYLQTAPTGAAENSYKGNKLINTDLTFSMKLPVFKLLIFISRLNPE